MNSKIINEFTKFIEALQYNIDINLVENDKEKIKNTFRLRSLKNILNILKKIPNKITLNNVEELKKLPGIGEGTIIKIKEILTTGQILEFKNFKHKYDKNIKIIEELETVIGIGHKLAIDLVKKGIKSIKDLKQKIKNKEIKVNDKIKLGIKYHNKFFDNIPRSEITSINNLLNIIIDEINNKLSKKNKYILTICGSYRREKLVSGDIDILISKLDNNDDINHLQLFINKLKNPLAQNNNKPLIIDDITDKNYTTKYMGFLKYKDNLVRRIDFRYVPWKYYYPALLYFTGSAEFNRKMRNIAKQKGYKLSEYGLYKISDGSEIKIDSEQHIFDILNIEYIEPKYRI